MTQVIMGPGIEADTTFDFIGSNVDVAPTFLALAGLDPKKVSPPMDGSKYKQSPQQLDFLKCGSERLLVCWKPLWPRS